MTGHRIGATHRVFVRARGYSVDLLLLVLLAEEVHLVAGHVGVVDGLFGERMRFGGFEVKVRGGCRSGSTLVVNLGTGGCHGRHSWWSIAIQKVIDGIKVGRTAEHLGEEWGRGGLVVGWLWGSRYCGMVAAVMVLGSRSSVTLVGRGIGV